MLENIFSQASSSAAPCEPPPWALSGVARLPPRASSRPRTLGVYVSKQLVYGSHSRQLIFIMGTALIILIFTQLRRLLVLMEPHPRCPTGSSLEEAVHLTSGYQNVVPVTSSGGHMTLLDLSAPFLLRGRRRYYGSEFSSWSWLCAGVKHRSSRVSSTDLCDSPALIHCWHLQGSKVMLSSFTCVSDAGAAPGW